jgi:acyl-homoserine lactone acylase PvdQ
MRVQGIPMFNTVFADRDDVFYVYNALLPRRAPGHDYRAVLPGDRTDLVFHEYLSFDELPQVHDPPSGFVQTCNATPFAATAGAGNPSAADYPPEMGIELTQTNRALRSLAILGQGGPLSRADFVKMKFDRKYDRASKMFTHVVDPIVSSLVPSGTSEARALELLRGWDGVADESSPAATLAILTYKDVDPGMHGEGDPVIVDPLAAFRDTVVWLVQHHGRVDVPLGEVQRLRRGRVDLPVGGGPDVLNATYSKREGAALVGTQGDSYVLLVDFTAGGAVSHSINNYGASARRESPHFADQAPLFVRHELKPTWRTPEELSGHVEREYHPGQ